ncbi:MAG: DUF5677 domain-containing protein [Chloroflexota bacterium]
MANSSYQTNQHNLLKQLEPFVLKLTQAIPNESNIFDLTLIAAIAKCFEFNKYIFAKELGEDSFFSLPTLRGICEDIISLKYLFEKVDNDDREDILKSMLFLNIYDGIKRQNVFFSRHRPLQPIVKSFPNMDSEISSHKRIIKNYKSKYQWQRNNPTTKEMATAVGLDATYEFLYAATSRTVHFTPHILIRMGWTMESIPENELRENIGNYLMQYSTSNFHGYYKNFCEFYGIQMLILILSTFSEYLKLPLDIKTILIEIDSTQEDFTRWPEIITFEEMNLKPPSPAIFAWMDSLHFAKRAEND